MVSKKRGIMANKSNQVNLIHDLSEQLKQAGIVHHFDGSTARFIHNDVSSMDDIDIVFPYVQLESVKKLFSSKGIIEETWNNELQLHHFKFYENGEIVHLLFYKETMSSFYDYHELVNFEGEVVWVKGIEHFQ